MYRTIEDANKSGAVTIQCNYCGGPMQIASRHVHMMVACPHCQQPIHPQRFIRADGRTACSWRNRCVAGLLGVLLGPFGVHRIYLGFVGIGILQMILSIVTFGIAGLWGFIEGVLYLAGVPMRDVQGLPLNDHNPFVSARKQQAAYGA